MILFGYRINAVSNAQVRGETYDSGCMGQTGKCVKCQEDRIELCYFTTNIMLKI